MAYPDIGSMIESGDLGDLELVADGGTDGAAADEVAEADGDRVRWLADEQQRDWRAFYYGTRRMIEAIDRDLMQESGIPLAYYEIFVRLSEAPDRSMRMSELAVATRSSRSRLSHAVSRLSEQGWAERLDCESDKRGQVAHLTDAGMALLEQTAPMHVESVRRWLIDAVAPGQLETLGDVGRTVYRKITGEDLAPS